MTDDFFLTPGRTPKYSFHFHHFGKFSFSRFKMKTVAGLKQYSLFNYLIYLIAWKF